MKVILKKDWNYIIFEEGDKKYISVVCGMSAIFEVKIELSQNEINILNGDMNYFDELADKVRSNCSTPLEERTNG